MKVAGVVLAVGVALGLQTMLGRLVTSGGTVVDLVLVAVVYVALANGPVGGMLTGSVAGIVQDALSSGVIGIGGLAKSVVGFVAGAMGQQFILAAAFPRFVVFVAATVVHTAIIVGAYEGLGLRTFTSPWQGMTGQAVANAIVGMATIMTVEAVPGILERRRLSRRPPG